MTRQQQECREAHGFWLEDGPAGGLWIMVPAGSDPADGLPLTHGRPALPDEQALWRRGMHAALARRLAAQGMPVRTRRERTWGEFIGGLFGRR